MNHDTESDVILKYSVEDYSVSSGMFALCFSQEMDCEAEESDDWNSHVSYTNSLGVCTECCYAHQAE